MNREQVRAILDSSPIAVYHGLRVVESPHTKGDLAIQCTVRVSETGANGCLHRSVMTLMLMAASHLVDEKGAKYHAFAADWYEDAQVGETVYADAHIKTKGRRRVIYARLYRDEAGDRSEMLATAEYGRLMTNMKEEKMKKAKRRTKSRR